VRIEAYFAWLRDQVAACLWVRTTRFTFDQRSTYQGTVRGEVRFADGSVLHVREFVDSERTVDRIAYAYQYMDAGQRLVFRYDNSGHHLGLNLPTYPHHKHDGDEHTVIAAEAPDMARVLAEISGLLNARGLE
jgi:hypothetical protein